MSITLTIADGPIGLNLHETEIETGAFVDSFYRLKPEEPLPAEKCEKIVIGDAIISVNEKDVSTYKLVDIYSIIGNIGRPVVLGFESHESQDFSKNLVDLFRDPRKTLWIYEFLDLYCPYDAACDSAGKLMVFNVCRVVDENIKELEDPIGDTLRLMVKIAKLSISQIPELKIPKSFLEVLSGDFTLNYEKAWSDLKNLLNFIENYALKQLEMKVLMKFRNSSLYGRMQGWLSKSKNFVPLSIDDILGCTGLSACFYAFLAYHNKHRQLHKIVFLLSDKERDSSHTKKSIQKFRLEIIRSGLLTLFYESSIYNCILSELMYSPKLQILNPKYSLKSGGIQRILRKVGIPKRLTKHVGTLNPTNDNNKISVCSRTNKEDIVLVTFDSALPSLKPILPGKGEVSPKDGKLEVLVSEELTTTEGMTLRTETSEPPTIDTSETLFSLSPYTSDNTRKTYETRTKLTMEQESTATSVSHEASSLRIFRKHLVVEEGEVLEETMSGVTNALKAGECPDESLLPLFLPLEKYSLDEPVGLFNFIMVLKSGDTLYGASLVCYRLSRVKRSDIPDSFFLPSSEGSNEGLKNGMEELDLNQTNGKVVPPLLLQHTAAAVRKAASSVRGAFYRALSYSQGLSNSQSDLRPNPTCNDDMSFTGGMETETPEIQITKTCDTVEATVLVDNTKIDFSSTPSVDDLSKSSKSSDLKPSESKKVSKEFESLKFSSSFSLPSTQRLPFQLFQTMGPLVSSAFASKTHDESHPPGHRRHHSLSAFGLQAAPSAPVADSDHTIERTSDMEKKSDTIEGRLPFAEIGAFASIQEDHENTSEPDFPHISEFYLKEETYFGEANELVLHCDFDMTTEEHHFPENHTTIEEQCEKLETEVTDSESKKDEEVSLMLPYGLAILTKTPCLEALRQPLYSVADALGSLDEQLSYNRLLHSSSFLTQCLSPVDFARIIERRQQGEIEEPLDFDLSIVVEALHARELVKLYLAVVLEFRIIIFGTNRITATVAICEWLRSSISPLRWCHIYAPTLPTSAAKSLISCPAPFILGLHDKELFEKGDRETHVESLNGKKESNSVKGLVKVNLDTGMVEVPGELEICLPVLSIVRSEVEKILYPRLYLSDKVFYRKVSGNKEQSLGCNTFVQVFRRFSTDLMREVKKYVVSFEDDGELITFVDEYAFLRSRENRKGSTTAEHDFLLKFLRTQCFSDSVTNINV